ncbi:MAG: TonB-dependent receptor plug domain-containing protein [Bacteroidia bacterium]|nr:TonB-dependent receptor plug domain-containing protein [Bacteroidia bacterium]
MKSHLITISILFYSVIGLSQSSINGKVLDSEKTPISNAFIKIKGTAISTYSTVDGNFSFNVPSNKILIVQISLSTETIEKKIGPFLANKEYKQNFNLKSSISLETAIVIGDKNRDRPLIKIDPKKLEYFSNTSGFEQKLKLIGIGISSGGGELSSGYSVRGGNFDENLVYVNDIEVYRPFLVRSGQQEGLSVINPEMVDQVEFSAGGFQAKYGDKLSSVLDIKYREPDTLRYTIQASLLGSSLHFENRSKNKRFSYLVGARFRANQYLLGSLDVQGDYKPLFFDLQTLLKYRLKSNLSLSYLSTLSQNRYLVSPQSQQTSFGNINSAISLFIAFGGNELMQYTTWMNALSLDYKPKKNITLKFNTSSYTTTEREHFTVEGAYRLSELETNFGSDDFANEKALLGIGYFIDHARNDLEAQVYSATHKGRYIGKNSTLQWGVGFKNEQISDRLKEWRYNDSSEYNITTINTQDKPAIVLDEFLKANIDIQSYRINGYIQNSQYINKSSNTKVTYGIRTNYWNYNQENVISPRMQFSWEPNKKYNDSTKLKYGTSDTIQTKRDWLLRFASGYYYQPPFYRELRRLDGTLNPSIKAQRSIHFVFGGDMNFEAWGRPFKFISELYYKHQDRMIPYIVDNVRIRYLAENSSQGYATGLDARVNGEFVEGIESWFNFSILQTKERLYYTDNNGSEQLSDWLRRPTDQRLNFSIMFQDELPSNPSYKLNLSLVYGSKMPFFFNAENRQNPGFKIPAYRRVDIGFSKILLDKTSKRRSSKFKNIESLWASIEVFNLLQVNNTISYVLVKDFSNNVYGVPNFLTGRRLNFRFILKI